MTTSYLGNYATLVGEVNTNEPNFYLIDGVEANKVYGLRFKLKQLTGLYKDSVSFWVSSRMVNVISDKNKMKLITILYQ